MKKRKTLGAAELEVLNYVSDHQPTSASEVARFFATTKGLARTTVLTVLERLRNKGYLRRRRVDGVWAYSPREQKSQVLKELVKDFVDRSLGGSVSPFMAYLVESSALTTKEQKELEKLLTKIEAHKEDQE